MWGLIIFLLVVILIVSIVIWAINIYNKLIKSRNSVDEAYSTMDVYMQKRYDLIPNLVETVQGYAKHEEETLTKVIQARNSAMNASSPEDKMANDGELTKVLRQLAVVIEKYPDLKANTNFLDLQATLKTLEEEIASSRKYYNGITKAYNNLREVFPSNIIANMYKFEKKPLYEIEDVAARKAPKVSFNKKEESKTEEPKVEETKSDKE